MRHESLDIHIGLSALLEDDLTSYEYFHSLPKPLQHKIEERDICSFEEMQNYVRDQLPVRGMADG